MIWSLRKDATEFTTKRSHGTPRIHSNLITNIGRALFDTGATPFPQNQAPSHAFSNDQPPQRLGLMVEHNFEQLLGETLQPTLQTGISA